MLVSRLSAYQKKRIKPDSLDFQIALSRVALDDTEEAVRLTEQELAGEYRELLLFLFKPEARPNGPFTFQAVWMTAALVKSPDTVYDEFKDFPYSAVNRAYLTGDIPCDVFTFEKPFGKVDRILQLIPPVSKNVAIKWRFGGYALFPYSAFGGDFLEGSFAGEGPEEIFVAFSECTSDLVGFIGAGSRKGCLLERFGTSKA